MVITRVYLSHFRNFKKAEFTFSPHLTIIVGENAKGKTSLLEAVYAAIYGTGFRESRELELLSWDHEQGIVESEFTDNEVKTLFQIKLQIEGEKRVKKTFFINKTHKPYNQFRQLQTQAVLFAPQHIEIITGSPSRRRVYVDTVLSAYDIEYKKKLSNYENALRKRNKVLELYVSEQQLEAEIGFWNEYLVQQASYITSKRREYIEYLNKNQQVEQKEFSIKYISSEFTSAELKRVYDIEKRMRRTVIGPQKDDFIIYLHNPTQKDVSLYGSRSEQRLAIFWLKINELQLFEAASRQKPILLLDDIFSELDAQNRQLVMGMVPKYQTIATTTEEEIKELSEKPELIHL